MRGVTKAAPKKATTTTRRKATAATSTLTVSQTRGLNRGEVKALQSYASGSRITARDVTKRANMFRKEKRGGAKKKAKKPTTRRRRGR